DFMIDSARAFAARLARAAPDDAERIALAFRLAYGRPPTAAETALGLEFLRSAAPGPGDRLTPWEQYAQALLATNEVTWVERTTSASTALYPGVTMLTRRELLARTGTGLGLLGLAGLLSEQGLLASDGAPRDNPLAPRAPHFRPRARRVIHLYMNGGPSQV